MIHFPTSHDLRASCRECALARRFKTPDVGQKMQMNRLAQSIRKHFSGLAQKEKWSFLWRTWLEAVILAYVIGNIVALIFPAGPGSDVARMTLFGLLGLVLFTGPLFETLAFQCLP